MKRAERAPRQTLRPNLWLEEDLPLWRLVLLLVLFLGFVLLFRLLLLLTRRRLLTLRLRRALLLLLHFLRLLARRRPMVPIPDRFAPSACAIFTRLPAGQSGPLPVQVSATSHGPAAARHSIEAGWKASAGQ